MEKIRTSALRWFWALFIILGIGAGILFFNAQQIDPPPERAVTAERPPVETAPPGPAKAAPEPVPTPPDRRRYVLLFAAPGEQGLKPEPRDLPRRPTLRGEVRQVLEELIQGPRTPLVETLPRATRILEVFPDDQGTVYVDFSKEISAAHPGGVWAEASMVASIVQTLTVNFEAIRKVAFLVEGKSVETLAGHVDVRMPLSRLETRSFLRAEETPPRPQ